MGGGRRELEDVAVGGDEALTWALPALGAAVE